MEYITKSEDETTKLGFRLGKTLQPNAVVTLTGDLGAGKTAFVRGICSAFDVEDIYSPTFSLLHEYEGKLPVFHFDAYRIDTDAWLDAGFDEYLDAGGICVIEWAERISLPDVDLIRVTIEGSGEMPRRIVIKIGEGRDVSL